jgi:hypothetical protein
VLDPGQDTRTCRYTHAISIIDLDTARPLAYIPVERPIATRRLADSEELLLADFVALMHGYVGSDLLRHNSKTRSIMCPILARLHPGLSLDRVEDATGWALSVAAQLDTTTPAPTPVELRDLHACTAAHGGSTALE